VTRVRAARIALLGAALALAAASCAASAAPDSPTPLVEYHRSGGFAGVDDRVTVGRDGVLEVRDRRGNVARATLSPGDMKELAALLAGWNDLRTSAAPPPGPPDAFRYEITHDGVTVGAVEFGAPPPPAFDLVRKRLEGLAERAR
jgi:hypothetical protein